MRLVWLVGLSFLPGIEACAVLPEIPGGQCGNAVIDEHEDCDTFAPYKGALCRAPGSVDECRIDCSRQGNGVRRACPSDWGCSLDDICRPLTRNFEPRVNAALGNGGQLMAADFDGDGRSDVVSLEPYDTLGRTRLRFHYFDETGALEQSVPFPKLLFSPVIAELSADARSDIAFSDTRIGLLLGGDRSWVPETFGSYRLPNAKVRMLAASDQPVQDTSAVIALTTLAGQAPGFYVPNGVDRLTLAGESPGPLDSLMGDPVTGMVFEDKELWPCLQSVVAFSDGDRFYLVDYCTRDETGGVAWREQLAMQSILLSPPAAIDAPPQLVDMNGDGHLDVLLGAGGRPYVAYGDGEKLAAATPFRLSLENPEQTKPDIPMPLAAGDFTSDGLVDFVFPDHLLVSALDPNHALPRYVPDRANNGGTWSEALIVDLNGNGKLDVVAASHERANIDFFNGTGGQHPTLFTLPTNGPVRELIAADFDGDLVADLAFMETSVSRERSDSLLVAFGNLAGSPATPVTVARIEGVEQLAIYEEGGLGNLMVAASEFDGQKQTGVLTLLEGSGDRTLTAPYSLTLFSSEGGLRQSMALSLAAGAFSAPGQRDVLSLASSDLSKNEWEFWLLPELASDSRVPRLLSADFDEHLRPAGGPDTPGGYMVNINVGSVSADLDGEGRDEAVFAMPTDTGGCGLVVAGTEDNESVHQRTVLIDDPCTRPQLVAVDADADGAVDIALLTGSPGVSPARLLLFWNDGRGGFSDSRMTRVSDPADSPVEFTVLPAISELRRLGFAYVTESEVKLVTGSEEPRAFEQAERIAPLEHGTGIVAADVNGDRALDLAITDSGTLSVLKAELEAP